MAEDPLGLLRFFVPFSFCFASFSSCLRRFLASRSARACARFCSASALLAAFATFSCALRSSSAFASCSSRLRFPIVFGHGQVLCRCSASEHFFRSIRVVFCLWHLQALQDRFNSLSSFKNNRDFAEGRQGKWFLVDNKFQLFLSFPIRFSQTC